MKFTAAGEPKQGGGTLPFFTLALLFLTLSIRYVRLFRNSLKEFKQFFYNA